MVRFRPLARWVVPASGNQGERHWHMARIETELIIDGGQAIVSLGGSLDVSNVHRLGAVFRRLVTEGCTDIVLDLGGVSSIDAAGIGIMRGAAALVSKRCHGRLCSRNAPPDLAELLIEHGIAAYDGAGPVPARQVTDEPAVRPTSAKAGATRPMTPLPTSGRVVREDVRHSRGEVPRHR